MVRFLKILTFQGQVSRGLVHIPDASKANKKVQKLSYYSFLMSFRYFWQHECTYETMETKLIISSNNWLKKSELYWYKYLQISFIGRIFTKCPWWPWYVYYHWRYVFHHTTFPMDQTCQQIYFLSSAYYNIDDKQRCHYDL